MRLTITLLLLLACTTMIHAQLSSPAIASKKNWSVSSNQTYLGSCLTGSDIGLAGYITDPSMTYSKGFLSVYNGYSYDTLTSFTSNLNNHSEFYTVAICDGCYPSTKTYAWPVIGAGFSEATPGDRDVYVYTSNDLNGTMEWVDVQPNNQEIKHILQEYYASTSFIFCGYNEQSAGNKDCWIGRLEAPGNVTPFISNGNIFGGSGDDVLNASDMSESYYLLASGYTTTSPAVGKDFNVILFEATNQTVFVDSFYQIPGDQELLSISYSDYYTGKFVGVGYSDVTGSDKDMFVVAFDEYSADTLWTRTFGTPYDDVATSVRYISFGMLQGFVISGYSLNANGEKEVHVYFVDTDGWILSERQFGEAGSNIQMNTLEVFADGCNYFLFGQQDNEQVSMAIASIDYTIDAIDPYCFGSVDGQIVFNDLNSFFPTIYLWDSLYNSLGSGYNFNSLDEGLYHVDIEYFPGGMSKSSCFMYDSLYLTEPDSFMISFNLIDPDCYNSNGEIITTISGGVPPYDVLWTTTGADSLHLTGLSSGLYNFTVLDSHECANIDTTMELNSSEMPYIFGTTLSSLGPVTSNHGKAVLYKYGNTGGAAMLDSMDSYTIDLADLYQFSGLDTGSYAIKIFIDSTNYYPHMMNSYYAQNDTVMQWTQADIVYMGCDDTLQADVNIFEMNMMENGVGNISGFIYLYTYSKAVGEPVPGAEILIEQEPNDIPIQAAFSDQNGYYHVNGLDAGSSYSMQVEIPGYPMINTYTNIPITSTDTVYQQMNFYVDTTLNGGIMADTMQTGFPLPNQLQSFSVNAFPNPFFNDINIEMTTNKDGFLWMDIVNLNGQEVKLISNQNIIKGNVKFNWRPGSDIPSGTYFIRVRLDNDILIKKILLQK